MKAVFSCLLVAASGVRVDRIKQEGAPGSIAGVWSAAAPGTSTPPLTNPLASDGCFPGARSWATRKTLGVQGVDIVTHATGAVGFAHMRVAGVEFNSKQKYTKKWPCNTRVSHRPLGSPANLHDLAKYYVARMVNMGELENEIAKVGLMNSYEHDEMVADGKAGALGFTRLGSAHQKGDLYVGKAVSHLFEKNGKCIVTFQGTQSFGDWTANLNKGKARFCGLVHKYERCTGNRRCKTVKAGGSFVHRGFRDALRTMVSSDEWQQNIHAKFSQCSELHVAGHSLGAAQSELFGACVNQQLSPGDYGYEDYKLVSFFKK